MRSALLIASEQPPSLRDVKAALLTYDSVHLLDPDDRDLFPSTGMPIAIGMPPVMSFPSPNPVRRIGKIHGYDEKFEIVLSKSKAAIAQGSLLVSRSYQTPSPDFSIGMVDLGGFPLNISWLMALYRAYASDPVLQTAAIQNDAWLYSDPENIFKIAESRGVADGSINNDPPLPDLSIPLANEGTREALSNIARARIGHAIKLTGYCMTQGFVPHGVHSSHDAILRAVISKSASFIDEIVEVDPYWNYRNRALKLAHDEYIDYNRLDEMSIENVLDLRTVSWGRQADARDELLESIGKLARELIKEQDFDRAASEKIRDYRQKAAEIEDERAALRFRINCEIGKSVINLAGITTAGTITSLGTGVGAAAALLAGGYFALQQYQDLKPISDELRLAEEEFKFDARYGIHNFYQNFP